MRIHNSMLNILFGVGNQFIITALSFLSRTIFINSLGIEYLGISALFTSVLAMLSIAEAGISSSIIYSLYKPVANNDQPQIIALMNLYKKAYNIIAFIILGVGLLFIPFLPMIIKDANVDHITFIYLIFLLNTVIPYFFVYKHSFLNVNQKNYVVTAFFTVSTIISTTAKIAILYLTDNYILYLLVESVLSIFTTIILAKKVDRLYPYLRMATNFRLDSGMIQGFKKNMKAIILQNIGMYLIFGVDSILISYFVSFIAVGLYSNYKMFFEICRTFVNQIFANIFHSVGNLVAQESKEKIYSVYKATMLLTFWLYGLLSILLYLMLEPLIRLWIGNEFIMDNLVLLFLVLMFWERGMRYSLTTVKITSGIFQEDRYGPLAQAAINLAVSLFLVHKMGIAGVFLGSLISAVCVPFWTIPYLVYKKVFEISIIKYYNMYFYYLAIGLASYFAARFAVQSIPDDHILMFIVKGAVVFIVVNICFFVMFRRSEEFKFLISIAVTLGQKIPIVNRLVKKRLAVSGA